MALRYRLWLLFAPLLALLTVLGAAFIYSLGLVGHRIDAILQENYRSVDAMTGLNEAADRIDSSFQFAMAGRAAARQQYGDNWAEYRKHLEFEKANITEPGEDELVAELVGLTERYRTLGDRFFDPERPPASQKIDYFRADGKPGPLLETFQQIKAVAERIRRLNQESMESASRDAQATAARAQVWSTAGLVAALFATGLLAWRTGRTILRPVVELTQTAQAVGDGRFDRSVAVTSHDEIGALAAAFNRMTAQLRDLRQTQAARLLRAQQASQAAIDSFPDPVLVVDAERRVEMANPAARRVLGVVPEQNWQPPERLREPLATALHTQQPVLMQSFEGAIGYRVAGEERTFVPQVLPVRDPYGNTLGAAVVLNDITRFRLLDEFKSDLVATASHELKTPLASLRLAVHLLLEETVGPLTAKQSELLIDARENTERLVRIVDELLALARLENRQEPLALHPEDPEKLLRAAVERVGPRLSNRTVEYAIERDRLIPALADDERLGHALDNLLVNAAVYTEPGGIITLGARRSGEDVELSIRDNGIGIPPEFLPHVFDKFFRIPGQTRGRGAGLGLAIVREIASAHGGRVACENAPGQGALFRIWLPGAR